MGTAVSIPGMTWHLPDHTNPMALSETWGEKQQNPVDYHLGIQMYPPFSVNSYQSVFCNKTQQKWYKNNNM